MALADRARYARRGGLSMDWKAVQEDAARIPRKIPHCDAQSRSRWQKTLSGGIYSALFLSVNWDSATCWWLPFIQHKRSICPLQSRRGNCWSRHGMMEPACCSSRRDLDELFTLSDTILVLSGGRIVGRFRPDETTRDAVGHLMTGSVA